MTKTLLDQAVDYLTEQKLVKVQDIAAVLGMPRTSFNSARRSSKDGTREELLQKIVAAYPEHFPGGRIPGAVEEPTAKTSNDIYERHISLLQRVLEKAEADLQAAKEEIEELKRENLATLERLKTISKE